MKLKPDPTSGNGMTQTAIRCRSILSEVTLGDASHGTRPGVDPRRVREQVQQRLAELLPAGPEGDRVCTAMREFMLTAGKRMRPVLMVMAARGMGHADDAIIDVGCAVEMVHGASLILDDLPSMDNAELRRGQPTVHRQHGEDVAILASVALLSRAFQVLAELEGIPAPLRSELLATLAAAVGSQGLVCGQFNDLHGSEGARDVQAVQRTNELKTGALFSAALEMAAMTAGASARARAIARDCAVELGQAFQLQDDLRDGDDSALSGKDGGKDAGKCTLITLLGREEVQRRLQAHLQRAFALLAELDGQHDDLVAFTRQHFRIA